MCWDKGSSKWRAYIYHAGEPDIDVPKLILSYRPSTRAPYFGVYGAVEATGTVSVGDAVELIQTPAI